MTLANSGLGARAEDDAEGAIEDEIMSQGEEGEQSRMTGGGAWQHTTGASKEMTQKGPDIALAEEETQIPLVSPHDTLADILANSGLGARAEDDAAAAMEGEIMSQGEEGEQSRMAGGPGCRAAHHRGEQNIRGDVIWRPRHVAPHAKGRVHTGCDSAWVRREQSRRSWDPPISESEVRLPARICTHISVHVRT